MAYTYNDFVNAATSANLMDQFDDDDLATAQAHPEYGLSLLGLKQDYGKATTEEQKLLVTEATNQLRNSYGLNGPSTGGSTAATAGTSTGSLGTTGTAGNATVSGPTSYTAALDAASGGTGTSTDAGSTTGSAGTAETGGTTAGESSGSFAEGADTTAAAETTTGETADATAATTDAATTTPTGNNIYAASLADYTYDPTTDPSYQSYRKQYLREADRATADTLGEASAASAGRPNSYAVNAAQQAGDYYRGQLADTIPTLENNAYQRQLDLYNAENSERSATYSNLVTTISNTGYMPSAEELARAGMTEDEAIQWRKQWAWTAYKNGQIGAKDYYNMFGEYPHGYTPGGGGGSGYDDGYQPETPGSTPTFETVQDGMAAAGGYNNYINNLAEGVNNGTISLEDAQNAADKANVINNAYTPSTQGGVLYG